MNFEEVLHGKTVLVTGATGFIGSHFLRRLAVVEGIKIFALTRKAVSPETALAENSNVHWVQCELNNLSSDIWRSMGINCLDYVIHLAGFIPKWQANADNFEEVMVSNIEGTQSLLSSLPRGTTKVVFASTVDVYETASSCDVIKEATPVQPMSLYGGSKFLGEVQVRQFCLKNGVAYAILRYGHIFGPGEAAYRKLIPETIRKALSGVPPIIYGDGGVLRDFLYVDDVVEATLRATISEKRELGPINITRGTSTSICGIVETIIKVCEATLAPIIQLGQSTPRSLVFDNSEMRKSLGEWDFISLEEGIKREVNYFKEMQIERVR